MTSSRCFFLTENIGPTWFNLNSFSKKPLHRPESEVGPGIPIYIWRIGLPCRRSCFYEAINTVKEKQLVAKCWRPTKNLPLNLHNDLKTLSIRWFQKPLLKALKYALVRDPWYTSDQVLYQVVCFNQNKSQCQGLSSHHRTFCLESNGRTYHQKYKTYSKSFFSKNAEDSTFPLRPTSDFYSFWRIPSYLEFFTLIISFWTSFFPFKMAVKMSFLSHS